MTVSSSTASTRPSSLARDESEEERFLQERVYELTTHVDRLTRYQSRITDLLLDVIRFGTDEQAAQARKVLKDSGWAHFCHYCGDVATTTDHIVPKALGGVDVRLNQVDACVPCNKAKGSDFPQDHCPKCTRAIAWHSQNSLGFRKTLRERRTA